MIKLHQHRLIEILNRASSIKAMKQNDSAILDAIKNYWPY